jgi:carbon monoxide dehydrogenase subunit G
MRMRYEGGFIEGAGEWRIQAEGKECRVSYRLDVAARGWLVAVLGRLIDLPRQHSRLMREVLAGLRATVLESGPAGAGPVETREGASAGP